MKFQLYEIDDDPNREVFLNALFDYMRNIGDPIKRLPIMAGQPLDLYQLYNLVINRGGLVDVINKKLWQEVIKGLRLPSSITSAAFTLREQYKKNLFPYECFTLNISTEEEAQEAIEGNRRVRTVTPPSANHNNNPMPQFVAPERPMAQMMIERALRKCSYHLTICLTLYRIICKKLAMF